MGRGQNSVLYGQSQPRAAVPKIEVDAQGVESHYHPNGELFKVVLPMYLKQWQTPDFQNEVPEAMEPLLGEWSSHKNGSWGSFKFDGGWTLLFEDGKLHCKDGPAATHPDGRWQRHENGMLHCEDGPAFLDYGGGGNPNNYTWFLYGQGYHSERDFKRALRKLNKNRAKLLAA